MFEIFLLSQNLGLVSCFESLSLKHVQGSRVLHFTMLAPNFCDYCNVDFVSFHKCLMQH